MFWRMIEEISNEDRQLLLKFMCGRTRLQPGVRQTINFENKRGGFKSDKRLPIGHTCGNSIDVPFYSSGEVMKR